MKRVLIVEDDTMHALKIEMILDDEKDLQLGYCKGSYNLWSKKFDQTNQIS